MVLFVFLLAAVGGAIGGAYGSATAGLLLCLAAGIFAAAGAFFGGDRLLLSASGAREIAPSENPQLHNIVEELCIASGLPKPRLFLIESAAPNAFATGRSPGHAAVAVTSGLVAKLGREELQGVLAHELSHIRNLDVRYAMLVGVLVGMVALLCDAHLRGLRVTGSRRSRDLGRGGAILFLAALVLAILAPFAARLVQLAISRRRELLADASAVEFTRNPLGLASALRRIGTDPAPLEVANRATQHLYISNPVRAAGPASGALLSTHPPIEARIRILESMA
jgi:heat shock protein HtpX